MMTEEDYEVVFAAAHLLTEPEDSNPEYDRALIELVRDTVAMDMSRAEIMRLLRANNPAFEGLDDTVCDDCGMDAGADLFTDPRDPHAYCEPCYRARRARR